MNQGMMSPPKANGQTYNGTVDVMGTPVEVKDGVAEVQGHKFYVSNDGQMVADEQGRLVGFVQDGKFQKNTNEHLKMLLDKGLIQEGGK